MRKYKEIIDPKPDGGSQKDSGNAVTQSVQNNSQSCQCKRRQLTLRFGQRWTGTRSFHHPGYHPRNTADTGQQECETTGCAATACQAHTTSANVWKIALGRVDVDKPLIRTRSIKLSESFATMSNFLTAHVLLPLKILRVFLVQIPHALFDRLQQPIEPRAQCKIHGELG